MGFASLLDCALFSLLSLWHRTAQNVFTVLLQLQSDKYVYQRLIIFWTSLKTSEEKEQGVCIFARNLGKNGVETYAMLKNAFGDGCWSHASHLNRLSGPQCRLPSTRMEGIVHQEYVPEALTVNHLYYVEVLKGLRLALCCKRPKKRKSRAWAAHHDNAPAHTDHLFQVFFFFKQIMAFVWFTNCHNSPDVAPCDFWLFPKLAVALKGKIFDNDTFEENMISGMSSIRKDSF